MFGKKKKKKADETLPRKHDADHYIAQHGAPLEFFREAPGLPYSMRITDKDFAHDAEGNILRFPGDWKHTWRKSIAVVDIWKEWDEERKKGK